MFSLAQHFETLPFLLALVLGLFAVHVLKPAPTVVVRTPNLENAGSVTYADANGTCFVYDASTVDCDANADRIALFPLQ
jgi:hypothetical protein